MIYVLVPLLDSGDILWLWLQVRLYSHPGYFEHISSDSGIRLGAADLGSGAAIGPDSGGRRLWRTLLAAATLSMVGTAGVVSVDHRILMEFCNQAVEKRTSLAFFLLYS